MNKLRDNIKKELSKRGWTQTELAKRADIPGPTLNRFLTGKRRDIKADAVVKIARALNLSEAQLRGLDERLPPNYVHAKAAALLQLIEAIIADSGAELSEQDLIRIYKAALSVGMDSEQLTKTTLKAMIDALIGSVSE